MNQLNIKALERRTSYSAQFSWRFVENKNSWRNAGFWQWSGVNVTEHVRYVDPDLEPEQTQQWGGVSLYGMNNPYGDYQYRGFDTGGYSGTGSRMGGISWGAMPMQQTIRWG
jgi:hypothetical protein